MKEIMLYGGSAIIIIWGPKRLIVTNNGLMLVVAELWPLKKRRIEDQFGPRPLMGVDVNATTIAGALQGLLAFVVLAP